MLPSLLVVTTLATAAPLASIFQHSSHRAPLRRGQGSLGGAPSGLRRRAEKPGVTPADVPTLDHTVGIDIQANGSRPDNFYFIEIEAGTPPSSFNLILDTGSSDLILPSESCKGCNHHGLGPESSSTFVGSAEEWLIPYDTGPAAGTVCNDTVTVAGFTFDSFKFGVIETSSSAFNLTSFAYDGILGTGPSSLSLLNATPVPEEIVRRGWGKGVTGYRLGRSKDGENVGEVTFGGVDTAAYTEPVVTSSTTLEGHWGVALEAVSVDGNDLALGSRNLLLDTGTYNLLIPAADAAALHAHVPDAQGPLTDGTFTLPCDTTASVAFTIGGASFAIDPRDLVLEPTDAEGVCVSGVAGAGEGVLAGPDGQEVWLVGDVFLKNVYHATSIDDNTIMIAALAEPTGPASQAGDASKAAQASRRFLGW